MNAETRLKNVHTGMKIHSNDFDAVVTFVTDDGYYLMYESEDGTWKDIIMTDTLFEKVDNGEWTI